MRSSLSGAIRCHERRTWETCGINIDHARVVRVRSADGTVGHHRRITAVVATQQHALPHHDPIQQQVPFGLAQLHRCGTTVAALDPREQEAPFGQTLGAEPVAVLVPAQRLQAGRALAQEEEDVPAAGILLELGKDDARQARRPARWRRPLCGTERGLTWSGPSPASACRCSRGRGLGGASWPIGLPRWHLASGWRGVSYRHRPKNLNPAD